MNAWVCSECQHNNHKECKGTVGGDKCTCDHRSIDLVRDYEEVGRLMDSYKVPSKPLLVDRVREFAASAQDKLNHAQEELGRIPQAIEKHRTLDDQELGEATRQRLVQEYRGLREHHVMETKKLAATCRETRAERDQLTDVLSQLARDTSRDPDIARLRLITAKLAALAIKWSDDRLDRQAEIDAVLAGSDVF